MGKIPIVIPVNEPNEKLVNLCHELREAQIEDILVVDNGSREDYAMILDQAAKLGAFILHQEEKGGRGRALKSAFIYLLQDPEVIGCITIDLEGLNSSSDILQCIHTFEEHPNALVLAYMDYDPSDKSAVRRFGNHLIRSACKWLCGMAVSDVRTRLRAIPADFMKKLLDVPGERSEFEINMLLETRDCVPIIEVPVRMRSDPNRNHRFHSHHLKDSLKIYAIFAKRLIKFAASSLSASAIDLGLFALFSWLFKYLSFQWYIAAATVLARIASCLYNYLVNYNVVFKSRVRHQHSVGRYFLLAACIMSASALLVTAFSYLLPMVPELIIKIVVDVTLFFVNYTVQSRFVFQ